MSFVVIAYNEEQGIANTLASIVAQRDCELAEVIVVDDASQDGTSDAVLRFARHDERVRLVRHESNLGRGAARNRGFQETRGAFVAYIDADIVLPPNWFTRCFARLQDQSLDAVGGVAVPDGDVTYLYRRLHLKPKVVAATTTVTGNNGLYRRSVFERITFDPALREGEDIAFNHAVSSLNARMETIRDLHVRHEEDKSFLTSVIWLYQSGVGATRMLVRYRSIRVPDLATGLWIAAMAAAAVGGVRRRPELLLAPVVVAGAGAVSHVNRAFIFERQNLARMLGAVLVDTVFLTAYFVGRVAGIRRL